MKKSRIIIGIFIFILVILWGVCIYKFSAMNTKNSNGKSKSAVTMLLETALEFTNDLGITNSHPSESKIEHASSLINSPFRKFMHASIYFVLAFVLILGLNVIIKNFKFKYLVTFIITLLLCFGYACSDEYHQTKVEGRTGQFKDVMIDTTGALAGCLFFGTYYIAYIIGKNDIKKPIVEKKKIKKVNNEEN